MAAPLVARGKRTAAVERVRGIAADVIQDRKKANDILDILNEKDEDDEVVVACIGAMERIFLHYISIHELYLDESSATTEAGSRLLSYKMWLRDRYGELKKKLYLWLQCGSTTVQRALAIATVMPYLTMFVFLERALAVLMKLVEAEGKNPLERILPSKPTFPVEYFKEICDALLLAHRRRHDVFRTFQEYLTYDDVRYYYMRNLHARVDAIKKEPQRGDDDGLNSVYSAMELIKFPNEKEATHRLTKFIAQVPDTEKVPRVCDLKEHRKLLSALWQSFLNCKLTERLFKKVLLFVPTHVMPHLSNPLMLSEFFTASYNIGGVVSLLALNGLFTLMHKHNLDYPEFFSKLYALLQPSLFGVKYKARFFYLLDLFLQSTLLPAYLVAAFAKRLSRLTLVAPPDGILLVLPFVTNLLIRHKSCLVLVHNEHAACAQEDPYDYSEYNLSQCHALQSSLWEIKSLQNHYYHTVATAAKRFNDPLPQQELDLTPYLELSTDTLVEREVATSKKKHLVASAPPAGIAHKHGTVPVNPLPPKKLCLVGEEFSELWSIAVEPA